jgi:hypothetical protein
MQKKKLRDLFVCEVFYSSNYANILFTSPYRRFYLLFIIHHSSFIIRRASGVRL